MLSTRDKIVQEAVRQAIEPIFEQRFLDCSYAYRSGRGPQRALARVNHYLQYEGRTWIAECDIDEFFDSLDHERLLAEVHTVEQESMTKARERGRRGWQRRLQAGTELFVEDDGVFLGKTGQRICGPETESECR